MTFPALGNSNGGPLIELLGRLELGNALTCERVLQRRTPSHLWTTDRPKMRYQTCHQLPWRPAHGPTCDVASSTKKPISKVAVDVKETQATEKTIGSGMLAEGMIKFMWHMQRAHLLWKFRRRLNRSSRLGCEFGFGLCFGVFPFFGP